MEKAEENTGTSNVENENVELNGNLIAKGKIKNFMLNHMTVVFTIGEGPNGKKTEGMLYLCK
ncbi:hypothetical protein RDI58_004001 [Solanum bulbocastanum]|uniref:Uncharacterized protein n=1 Tax=Solanum bulbocastanum TaxID=147425 RepID=A0AAN8YKV8_SOLBU